MKIQFLQRSSLFITAAVLLLSACGKRCQAPTTTPFTTITGQEWRLIQTNNPRMSKDITRYSFLIMVFKTEFEGELYKVTNNKRYDTPLFTFQYNVAAEGRNGRLRIIYSTLTGEDPSGGQGVTESSVPSSQATSQPTDYYYELRSGLKLIEAKTGYVYEFVPFVGVVDPDSTCTF